VPTRVVDLVVKVRIRLGLGLEFDALVCADAEVRCGISSHPIQEPCCRRETLRSRRNLYYVKPVGNFIRMNREDIAVEGENSHFQ